MLNFRGVQKIHNSSRFMDVQNIQPLNKLNPHLSVSASFHPLDLMGDKETLGVTNIHRQKAGRGSSKRGNPRNPLGDFLAVTPLKKKNTVIEK